MEGRYNKRFDPSLIDAQPVYRSRGNTVPSRLVPLVMLAGFLALLAVGVAVFWQPIQSNARRAMEVARYKREIAQEQDAAKRASQEAYALQEDPEHVELMARDILNYGRAGEVIFKFPPYKKRQELPSAP
jgi:cell division protein FtsB